MKLVDFSTDPGDRAEAGQHVLDQYVPGWREMIEIDYLNVASTFHCPIAYVGDGSFNRGLRILEDAGCVIPPGGSTEHMDWLAAHGFECLRGLDEADEDYEALTEAWLTILHEE